MKIVFMGTPDFAVTTLDMVEKAGHEIILVVTQPDKPKGRSGALAFPPVKEWAVEHNVPVFQPVKIRAEEAVNELKKYEADLFLVAAFGQILPKVILDMPRLGCVNVHASLLPKYRGAAPIQWAVINGDEYSGVTTMMMGVGLDDGDMLLKKEVKLEEKETGGSLFDRLALAGGELAIETIEKLDKGQISPVPQNEAEATHVGMISKAMGQMDFSRPAVELERLVRGLNPWPSAYTSFGGKNLKIWASEVVEKQSDKKPGTVIAADPSGITVACGENCLLLTEIQLEGKKRMLVSDFLRGRDVPAGTILGE